MRHLTRRDAVEELMGMTSKAYVQDDFLRDGIAVAIVRDHGGRRELLKWEYAVHVIEDDARGSEEYEDRLRLQYDDARALYESLAEHFGHVGHDGRALRKDYDAERSRVDKLIAHLTSAP